MNHQEGVWCYSICRHTCNQVLTWPGCCFQPVWQMKSLQGSNTGQPQSGFIPAGMKAPVLTWTAIVGQTEKHWNGVPAQLLGLTQVFHTYLAALWLTVLVKASILETSTLSGCSLHCLFALRLLPTSEHTLVWVRIPSTACPRTYMVSFLCPQCLVFWLRGWGRTGVWGGRGCWVGDARVGWWLWVGNHIPGENAMLPQSLKWWFMLQWVVAQLRCYTTKLSI